MTTNSLKSTSWPIRRHTLFSKKMRWTESWGFDFYSSFHILLLSSLCCHFDLLLTREKIKSSISRSNEHKRIIFNFLRCFFALLAHSLTLLLYMKNTPGSQGSMKRITNHQPKKKHPFEIRGITWSLRCFNFKNNPFFTQKIFFSTRNLKFSPWKT